MIQVEVQVELMTPPCPPSRKMLTTSSKMVKMRCLLLWIISLVALSHSFSPSFSHLCAPE